MNWRVELYQKANGDIPVKDFLESLSEKHRAKAYWEIELLAEYGPALKEPYVKHIKEAAQKNLWELRIKFGGDASRIFYFMPAGNSFILLHGFIKKTQKTPKNEIETALRYMSDFLARHKP